MLVLSRKKGQRIVIGHDIHVTVVEVRGGRVKLGFECPMEVPIYRQEISERIPRTPTAAGCPDCA